MAETQQTPRRLVVGLSGASGAILAVRLLEQLGSVTDYEIHLIVTEAGAKVLAHETSRRVSELSELVAHVHRDDNFFASVASGSFQTEGMVVIPCSMKTLAGIASGLSNSLLLRAADVCLKERRKLVLVTRETPLSLIHIENMKRATLAGALVLPPVLTMYSLPTSLDEMVDQIVGKVLDQLGISGEGYRRWS